MKIIVSNDLIELSKIFKFSCNTKLYIVGGYLRDYILNLPCNDIDLCSNLKIAQLEKILENTNYKLKNINYKFGTAKIISDYGQTYEYSTFRKELYTNNSHYPTKVFFTKKIKDDIKRRDFTANCLYYDITKNKLIDICNAKKDILNRTLKTVLSPKLTLKYDSERILRLLKYKIKLKFKIDKKTLKYAKIYSRNVNFLNLTTINKSFAFCKKISKDDLYTLKILLKNFKLTYILK